MYGSPDPHENIDLSENDSFPVGLKSGTSVLVASASDPADYAVGLQILCDQGTAKDSALVVTATENAEQTIERFEHNIVGTERPSLGIVDTTSQQSISALYCEPPIVYTPSPRDLERLVEQPQYSSAAVTYQHESNGTKFLVSAPTQNGNQFEIRLSTIKKDSTRIRHDYTVAEYDTRATALDKVESFLETVSEHLQNGTISQDNPEIKEVEAIIQSFRETHRPLVY